MPLFCKLLGGFTPVVEVKLFRSLCFTWKQKDGYRSSAGYLPIQIFYFLSTKKHRENGKSTGKIQGNWY